MKALSRLIAKRGNDNYLLSVENIVLFYTESRLTFILEKDGNKYIGNESLSVLEDKLNKEKFCRVNRQVILNIDFIKCFRTVDKVKIGVDLVIPFTTKPVIVSQECAALFRKWVSGETFPPC